MAQSSYSSFSGFPTRLSIHWQDFFAGPWALDALMVPLSGRAAERFKGGATRCHRCFPLLLLQGLSTIQRVRILETGARGADWECDRPGQLGQADPLRDRLVTGEFA